MRGRTRVRLHKCVSVRADVGVCLRVCVFVRARGRSSMGLSECAERGRGSYTLLCVSMASGQMWVPGISRSECQRPLAVYLMCGGEIESSHE